jgi:Uncharacterized protein conserved in bacteria (DUF2147)
MKRFACLMTLMALGSPAFARDSYSFSYRGHDIHIEASRHCRSLSCISVSVDNGRFGRDRDEDDVATSRDVAPALSPLPSQTQTYSAPVQSAPPATRAAPVLTAPPAQLPAQAPVQTQVLPVQAPARMPVQVPPAPPPVRVQPSPLPAPVLASVPSQQLAPPPPPAMPESRPERPAWIERPLPRHEPAPVAQVSQQTESDAADAPLGDWQPEGKGNMVRIEACGAALCGYAIDAATHSKGETVLVNMKPKNDTQWTGTVYSRSSGNSYNGKMTLKTSDTLHVEACALGPFFCSGNDWTRASAPAGRDELISSHEPLSSHS